MGDSLGGLGERSFVIIAGGGLDIALSKTAILESYKLLFGLGKLSLELLIGQLCSLLDGRCSLSNSALDFGLLVGRFGFLILIGGFFGRLVRRGRCRG